MASSAITSPVLEELRQTFLRGHHDAVITRSEQLLKRKKIDGPKLKILVNATAASSLIHLGRSSEALHLLNDLSTEDPHIENQLCYAKLYAAWAVNEDVSRAIQEASKLSGNDSQLLTAQLYYRAGRYGEAADLYKLLLETAIQALDEKKRPAAASRWGLASVTGRVKPHSTLVTAAELDQLTSTVNELATNYIASLVLGGRASSALSAADNLRTSYELEYDSACALIALGRFDDADVCLDKAEALIRAELDDDEQDIEEVIAPILVQRAYLRHLAGDVEAAEKSYAAITAERKADTASLAVAANNLTVALGQLAFGRIVDGRATHTDHNAGKVLPKEEHDALAEGLKKMRATSGRNIERKLTTSQRRAMARNRAVLLVQMGRLDACRTELAKVKSEFPDDPVVPLIEATLIAREANLDTAENILIHAGDAESLFAARAQLAVSHGDYKRAVNLLQQRFPGRPAALVTAATLLEENGEVDAAVSMMRSLSSSAPAESSSSAKKILAKMLLRNEKYAEACDILREVCSSDPNDRVARAQLVIATSYSSPEDAAKVAKDLPLATGGNSEIDAKKLESLPPPKRKHALNKVKTEANGLVVAEDDAAARAAAARERKKKKRKKRLPKNYDPNGPPPDPERWLPKTLRSGYKKKKGKAEQNSFRGSQGADAAAAEEAAQKNAEKSAARAAAGGADVPLPPAGRARLQRKKKGRR